MNWRRTGLLVLSGFLLFLTAGCGSDTFRVTLSWSGGDMDLAIQGPALGTYTTKDGVGPSGFFSADQQDGGSETFTLWPYIHESGSYDVGYECLEAGIYYTITIAHNGLTDTYQGYSSAGQHWVGPTFDVRQTGRR